MTNPNSGNIPISSHEQHWRATVAALAVGTAFFSLWLWLLPQWLGFRVQMGGAAQVNWVLDADIRGFFDNMSPEWTMTFIEHRVPNRRILRLIQKWLKAGISEDGQCSETKIGTKQGAVLSPSLANVYLHYAFDQWVEVWRKKVAKGDAIAVRYAGDLVLGFQHRAKAERFLRERLAKFGSELHADNTRLIEFGRFAARDRTQCGEGKSETFMFLGFTHYCGQRNSNVAFIVWRITAKKRMAGSV